MLVAIRNTGVSMLLGIVAVLAGCESSVPITAPASAPGEASNCATPATQSVSQLSGCDVSEKSNWRGYVLDSADGLIYPKAIYIQGDAASVSNPDALKAADGRVMTLNAKGTGKPTLMLDLGTNAGGHVEIGITKSDGTAVRLAYAEQRAQMSTHGDEIFPGLGYDDNPDQRYDLVTTKVAEDYVIPGIRGGQRWILLQLEGRGSVSIDYVRVRENHYRPSVDDYVGHFLSSDELLNRIWYASAYTFNLDSAQDAQRGGNMVAMDGAKRDRLVWTGDLGIEGGIAYYTTPRAATIMHDSIYMFACQQNDAGYVPMVSQIHFTCPDTITPDGPPADPEQIRTLAAASLGEYTAWWMLDAIKHYQYTGDVAMLQKLLPAMRRAVMFFSSRSVNGVYVTGQKPFEINWHPFDSANGVDTHTNAVWYRAITALAAIERQQGAGEQAALADEALASALRASLMASLWDAKAGAFLLNTKDTKPNHPQDGNVEAVYSGLIDGANADSAMNYLRQHLASPLGTMTGELAGDGYMSQYVSPFISGVEVLADFKRYDSASALALLRALWGHMVNTDPNVTVWEKVGLDGNPVYSSNSMAHGWAGAPVEALSGSVLGIRPTAPGFSEWIVEPQLGDLAWAQGQTYTPQGVVASRWERGTSSAWFRLTVVGPSGAQGTVSVPLLGSDRDIAMDGAVIWRHGQAAASGGPRKDGDYVVVPNISGKHTFAWTTH